MSPKSTPAPPPAAPPAAPRPGTALQPAPIHDGAVLSDLIDSETIIDMRRLRAYRLERVRAGLRAREGRPRATCSRGVRVLRPATARMSRSRRSKPGWSGSSSQSDRS